jgi:DNA-binding CsgD family transcriptional regulator
MKPILSPRQLEVVKLLANGLVHKEIADRLGLSTRTVSTHADHARKRYEARNVAHLIFLVFKP